MLRLVSLIALLLAAPLSACGEREEAPPPAPPDRGSAPDIATDPAGHRLHGAIVERGGHAELFGERMTGSLERGEINPQFLILEAPYCYRILGALAEAEADLEMVLIDPNGIPARRDPENGPVATLGLRHGVCADEPGRFRLELRARGASSTYAVQVLRQLNL